MIYFFKNHSLDADRRELRRDTALIPVEPQVFDLILYLVRNRDRVITKDDLIDAVWGGRIVSESALTTRINAARTAIGDSGKTQHFIRTLPRKGVRFVGEVREEPADPAQPSAASRSEPVVVRAEARDALAGLNHNLSSESRVHYRFGIASGELHEGADGPGGQAVGRAATLSLRAPSGAVRLSESVVAALADDPAFATVKVEANDYELAIGNASEPVKGLPIQLQSLDLPLPGQPSIVILPFKAIGDDASESEAFADGLRIEVQNALTKMSGVFLLGVGSALAMRGCSALDAATRTGVRYVLEGTVQRAGDQLRVSVQLTDTIAGAVVLSESYDRALDRNFALQDEITTCIVTALDVKLISGEQARIWHKGLTDPTARERFYRGIQSFFRMNAESMVYARDCFTLVSELAPASPLGPTWMALCLWFESARGWAANPAQAREQAAVWAEHAAAMEDSDGQAHTVLGNVRLLQRRFDEALAIASEAITIRPGCTNANGFLANVLLYCGEPRKAIAHASRAIRYMPVYPPWFVEILSAAYRDAGLLDLAIIAAREVPRIAPSTTQGRLVLASALVRSDWLADARRVVSDSRMLDANLSLRRWAASQPYRNAAVLADIIDDLRRSGVPE